MCLIGEDSPRGCARAMANYAIDSAILGVFILFCGSHPNVRKMEGTTGRQRRQRGAKETEETEEGKARGEAIPLWLACLVFSTVGLFCDMYDLISFHVLLAVPCR